MIEINLLPVREAKRKADLRQLAFMLGATLLGIVALAAMFHLSVINDISNSRGQIAQLQAQIDQFKPQLEQVELYRATKASIEEKLAVIERLDRNRSGPVRVLDELATHSPDRLWVTRISASNGVITIEGISLDNELVALFLTTLGDSPYFANVELQETEAVDHDGLRLNEFALTATLSTPAQKGVKDRELASAGATAGVGR